MIHFEIRSVHRREPGVLWQRGRPAEQKSLTEHRGRQRVDLVPGFQPLDDAVQAQIAGQRQNGVHDGCTDPVGRQGAVNDRSTFTELTGRVAR